MSVKLSAEIVEQLEMVLESMKAGGKLTIERTHKGWRVSSAFGTDERVGEAASFGEALENEREGKAGI